MLDRADLLGLISDLYEAVSTAHVELIQLGEMPMPLPNDVVALLEEGKALKETMEWIIQRDGTSPEMVAAVQRRLEAERTKAVDTHDGARVPIDQDTVRQLEGFDELLRRAGLLDADVAAAMRGAVMRSDMAGA